MHISPLWSLYTDAKKKKRIYYSISRKTDYLGQVVTRPRTRVLSLSVFSRVLSDEDAPNLRLTEEKPFFP